jgi:predicted Zn-dependent protease
MTLVLLAPAAAPAQESTQEPAGQATGPLQEALARLQAGDPEAAIALLEPLKGQAGTDPRALALLGALYVDTGRPAEAMEVLGPMAARQDADPAVLFHASRAAQALGRNDRAEEYLTRSAAADPVSPAARALGLIRALQGRYGQAFQLLYPWTQAAPDDREARLAAAQAAVRLGRVAEARELLGGLDPESPRVRLLQADLAMLLGESR